MRQKEASSWQSGIINNTLCVRSWRNLLQMWFRLWEVTWIYQSERGDSLHHIREDLWEDMSAGPTPFKYTATLALQYIFTMSLSDADRELPLLPGFRKYQVSLSFKSTISSCVWARRTHNMPAFSKPRCSHSYPTHIMESLQFFIGSPPQLLQCHTTLTLQVILQRHMFGQALWVTVCFGVGSCAAESSWSPFVHHTLAHTLLVHMNHLFDHINIIYL